ncbi:hypothetical protein [Phytoactinopolyspora mesophila]|uniref:Uncharacterized protein n=1 Tax=Phytoactinopolyspora mesophila TaxID=2650750 RepID=A0A7K3MBL7_9ACTN|nr:hypothetical protein [Phytoactinopolyspora mesophila]NDL60704.1 hypothetical protein [Phytoactinopolyspora mesophila]
MTEEQLRAAVERIGEAATDVHNTLTVLDRQIMRLEIALSMQDDGEQP